MPDRICHQCVLHVSKAYTFIKKCITSDAHIRRYRFDEKPVIDDEVNQQEIYEMFDGQDEDGEDIDQQQLEVELQQNSQPHMSTELGHSLADEEAIMQLQSDYRPISSTVHIESIEQIDAENDEHLPLNNFRVIKMEDGENDATNHSVHSIVYETETLDEEMDEQEEEPNDDGEQELEGTSSSKAELAEDSDAEVIPKMVYRRTRTRGKGGVPQPPYKCPTCDKVLSNYSSYKYHIQLHSNIR